MTDSLRARESSWGSEYVLERSVYTVTPLVEGVVLIVIKFLQGQRTNFPRVSRAMPTS